MCGLACRHAQFVQRNIFHLRDGFGNLLHIRRFAALAAMWHGREIGAICFQHELAQRRRGHGGADVLAVLEGHDAGVAHQPAHAKNLPQPLHAFAETMKHAARPGGERLDLREQIVEGTALVDDAVQTGLGRDLKLLPENLCLFLFAADVIVCAPVL